jgi:hypothetical protein
MRFLLPLAVASIGCFGTDAIAASQPKAHARQPQLAAGADDAAITAVRHATRAMNSVSIDRSQSFRIVDQGRHVATLVAGQGKASGAVYPGCFMSLVQDGKTTVVPTIGSGNWEAETCGRAIATGLIATGGAAIIAIVYDAASPNTPVREPVVLRWHRKDRTLEADEALSQQASERGATTIEALRRVLSQRMQTRR